MSLSIVAVACKESNSIELRILMSTGANVEIARLAVAVAVLPALLLPLPQALSAPRNARTTMTLVI
jgi:hypothetical protein